MTESFGERVKGLRGRSRCEGGLHLGGVRSVHTVGMKVEIDVAFLTDDLIVVRLARLKPWRFALRRRRVCSVLQSEAGSLERWKVRVGDQLVIRQVT
jgi:uncharacterized membrane protein (UPF0127 family)